MHRTQGLICQYLKGSPEGAQCSVVNILIRSLEDADIRLCMNRHHEACVYYMLSLREPALDAADSHRALETF